jgi:hypothetical protein
VILNGQIYKKKEVRESSPFVNVKFGKEENKTSVKHNAFVAEFNEGLKN